MSLSSRPVWYKRKGYPHFDVPWTIERAESFLSNASNVAHHAFLPFLSFEIKSRRFGQTSPKLRPIKYASHRDSCIFAYYGALLGADYESALRKNQLSDSVIAYRRGIGNNIDFARHAFDKIEAAEACVAIGFDIKNFFDSIGHEQLKQSWCRLLCIASLPDDHYSVFKAITKYSWVDRDTCYARLGVSQLQQQTKRPLCSFDEFRHLVKGRKNNLASLIQVNSTKKGIPQGSPISAILANIYLFQFDGKMQEFSAKHEAYYRRYSDDILWIGPSHLDAEVKELLQRELANLGLETQAGKTITSFFQRSVNSGLSISFGDTPFQYLGFTFDGKRRLIRNQTMSRYWRKVTAAVKKAKQDAALAAQKGRNGVVFKRAIFRRYTHLGQNNFIGYARRSAAKMTSRNQPKKSSIWKQVKNHQNKIERLF